MPSLDVSELNITISILGTFIIIYGLISTKIKTVWYLGEALPAVIVGICLGPVGAKFIDVDRWAGGGEDAEEIKGKITLGVCRLVIGIQLVIAGYQLPKKYQLTRWKEMIICLIPIMTLMWLCTTACIMASVPKLTLLTALVIGSCVTCTDPILSQAIAKGPFADKFVPRDLREIISSEAGANDGFGFPFLMLAVYLIRFADGVPGVGGSAAAATAGELHKRSGGVERQVGGPMKALGMWFIETWIYIVFLSIVYGAVVGFFGGRAIKYALRKKWVDNESYVLFPTAMGLFLVGSCGMLGTDDLLACFVAGNALNWDGEYLEETERRHDEVNSCVDVLLNFGGFMYIGTILPWKEFHQPDVTGITLGRLFGLGVLILLFRRIPSIFAMYKFIPKVCKDWKEALFMGYFGPIGIGAVFYLEHSRHLFPELEKADPEIANLLRAMGPVVYWLVFFSIVVHGLSIPILDIAYRFAGVQPIQEDAAIINRLSVSAPVPPNSTAQGDVVIRYNRFSRPVFNTKKMAENYDPEDYYNQKPLPKPRQSIPRQSIPRRSISFLPQ